MYYILLNFKSILFCTTCTTGYFSPFFSSPPKKEGRRKDENEEAKPVINIIDLKFTYTYINDITVKYRFILDIVLELLWSKKTISYTR